MDFDLREVFVNLTLKTKVSEQQKKQSTKRKKQPTKWQKIFVNHTFNNGLISKILKEFTHCNKKNPI